MIELTDILDMLDWNMPLETQACGRALAKGIEDIMPFIQPLTEKYNKNIWDNCAQIIASRDDKNLTPYLVSLMEWIQDINWPGAICILYRLQNYADRVSLDYALDESIKKALITKDEIWVYNLNLLKYKMEP